MSKTSSGTVRLRQLWQDMAPDMVARERMLRVSVIDGTHAECVVEHDNQAKAGRKTSVALRRFATSAFRLVEDAVEDADQAAHARFLKAMADVQGRSSSPTEYASAAMSVHKELLGELAAAQG
ncbi:DUF6354 family protein [Streptomyces sp. NPDC051555]|uniref:DUF6354 family protein n=1 Tax=Streptomyces sp. NPDC051555 TaxID=3365657 RepID=UPI00379D0EC5